MMKYFVDFQEKPKDRPRPLDEGEIVGIEASDEGGFVLLPNVGDYVSIDNSADKGERSSFSGKVRSRLFRYVRTGEEDVSCVVNIVIEETDDDWGALVKE